MNTADYFRLGHITKAFGLKGEMFFFVEVDLGDSSKKIKEVFFEENGVFVSRKIKKFEFRNKSYVISFEGIDNRTQAERMQKREIFVTNNFLPKLNNNEFYYHEISGCKVIDKTFGEVGVAVEIMDYPSQQILVVKRNQTEILIPFNTEFLNYFDREKKIIEISAPEGLIELYLNPPKQKEE